MFGITAGIDVRIMVMTRVSLSFVVLAVARQSGIGGQSNVGTGAAVDGDGTVLDRRGYDGLVLIGRSKAWSFG